MAYDAPRQIHVDIPEKLVEPLFSSSRYKGFYGGRGGGKSYAVATYVILRCLEKPTRVLCVREIQASIKESVHQLLSERINELGLTDRFQILETEIRGTNGSEIVFKGMRATNSAAVKSMQGIDIVWVEEAQTLSQKSLDDLRPTIRKAGSQQIYVWNPRFKTDPVDVFFRGAAKNPDAIAVEVSWKDNPFLSPESLRDKQFDYLQDPVKAQHVWGGGYEVMTEGSYYGRDIVTAENEGRITRVPYDREAPVAAAWDLGVGDNTSIVIFQRIALEWRILAYYENSGQALSHYVDWIKGLPYAVETHYLPHDARQRELQTGKSRLQFFAERGLRTSVVPNHAVEDGIHAVRMALPKVWIDEERCERLLDCLRSYRSEFSDKLQTSKPQPLHDWASHGADAMRYAIMGAAANNVTTKSDWSKPLARAGAGVA